MGSELDGFETEVMGPVFGKEEPFHGSLSERVKTLEEQINDLKNQLKEQSIENKVSIICFSGEWDRLFAALTIASGALAMGMETHLFFTFWAINALRDETKADGNGRSFLQSMFGRMLPSGFGRAQLSKFNCFGLGKFMMKKVMKTKGIEDIDALFEEVKELGAHFHLCETTTELFGLKCNDLRVDQDRVSQCGVATFISLSQKSKMVLFV